MLKGNEAKKSRKKTQNTTHTLCPDVTLCVVTNDVSSRRTTWEGNMGALEYLTASENRCLSVHVFNYSQQTQGGYPVILLHEGGRLILQLSLNYLNTT
jgi:hypothetical protein